MKITKTSNSRLQTTDFSNLPFGTVFSDHMLVCNYKNGKWGEAEIMPYGPLAMAPGSQVLHYGQAVFEGMKAFKSSGNQLLIFRKEESFNRINKSAERLYIPQIPKNIFLDGLDRLVSLDAGWCKNEEGYSLYIRPFIYASGECIKASSSEEFTFVIITSPTTTYYSGKVNLLVEQHYARAPRGGVGYAKAAGNYAASFYPTKMANAKGFTQLIWTDSIEHKYIEEAGTMNIWVRIGDMLITPELSDSILSGITRDSIITLAKDEGIVVQERKLSIAEVLEANRNGQLKEAFGTGTAVTVSPIDSITVGKERFELKQQEDSYAKKLKDRLVAIQHGRHEDKHGWTTEVLSSLTPH